VFDFMPALMPQVAAGRLVPLAVGSAARSPLMPAVPGLGEFADLGLGGLDLQSWNILTAPAGLPPALAEEIAAAVRRGAGHPGLADRLAAAGLVLATSASAAEVREEIARDAPRWKEMVEVSGARIE
jgi:tripartite-type tricarboxylate transporter receptor subunit TctC